MNEPMNDNNMTEMDDPGYEVCIVGCGPAGATLANLLGLCGVSVLVLEREGAAYPGAPAATVRKFTLAYCTQC